MNVYHHYYNRSYMCSKFAVIMYPVEKADRKLVRLQREGDEFTNLVGDFNTLLTEMDRYSRWKIIRTQHHSTASLSVGYN